MNVKEAFGAALRKARQRKGLTQEDFAIVSSRTYLSTLERGIKSATIEKTVDIAGRLGVHPLTLLIETFLIADPSLNAEQLFDRLRRELGIEYLE